MYEVKVYFHYSAVKMIPLNVNNLYVDTPHRQMLQICRVLQLSPVPEDPLPAVQASVSAGEVDQRPRLSPTLLHFDDDPSGQGGEDSTGACTSHPSHHTTLLVAVAVAGVFERPEQLQHQCRRHLPS